MSNYTQLAGIHTVMDTDFIQSANKTLIASQHNELKYDAYCSAYNFRNEGVSTIDFIQMSRLKRFTEELSEIAEISVPHQERHHSMELVHISVPFPRWFLISSSTVYCNSQFPIF
jgi:hypothetical protein